MNRILMLVPSLGMGGMERVCVNYCNLLVARGYSVTLINIYDDDESIVKNLSEKVVYKKNRIKNIPNLLHSNIKNLTSGNFRILNGSKWIKNTRPSLLYKKLITEKENEFDIEIAFYGGHMMRILTGSCQINSKKVGWIHSPEIQTHFPLFKSDAEAIKTYRTMDTLICVSNVVKEAAKRLLGNDVKAEVIYNPSDVKMIIKKSKDKADDFVKTKFTFINASRISIYHKGFDRLVEVVKMLKEDNLDFCVLILGDGDGYEALKDLVSKNNLNETIILMGQKDNPYKYMGLADCYICSSRCEGFSMVVSEAIVLGLPVISTDISGAREMLGDSEYGLVVENSENGLYEGMKKILTNEKSYCRIKESAQKRKNFFDENKIAEDFDRIIMNRE